MDGRQFVHHHMESATPELRAHLGRRRAIVEGSADGRGLSEGWGTDGHGRGDATGSSGGCSAPAVTRFGNRYNTSYAAAVSHASAGQYGGRFPYASRAPESRHTVHGAGTFDAARDNRINVLLERNQQLSSQVSKMKAQVKEAAADPLLADEKRERLCNESDETVAELERFVAKSKRESGDRGEHASQRPSKFRFDHLVGASHDQLLAELEALRKENQQLTMEVKLLRDSREEDRLARVENAELRKERETLQQEVQQLRLKAQENERLTAELAQAHVEQARIREQASSGACASSAAREASDSESSLRKALTTQGSTPSELRSAIGAVGALLEEAKRELAGKEHRERRAAYEELHKALEQADEARLESAVNAAKAARVDEEDLAKAEEKLVELKALTDEQRQAKDRKAWESARKKEAFLLVKKDDAAKLQVLIDSLSAAEVRWQDWRDYAGRSLWRCAQELRSNSAQGVLAPLLGLKAPEAHSKPKPWPTAAAVVASAAPAAGGATPSSPTAGADAAAAAAPPALAAAEEGGERPASLLPNGRATPGAAAPAPASATAEGEAAALEPATPAEPAEVDPFALAIAKAASTDTTPTTGAPSGGAAPGATTAATTPAASDAPTPSGPVTGTDEEERWRPQALRATVQDDPEKLQEVLDHVRVEVWSRWQNKAGKDLLTLAQERGSSLAYSMLAKAMGLVREQKRDAFEEREAVWVFLPGEVQPRRATVLQDTPDTADLIKLEYWDGDDPEQELDRAMVRKMWS
eukprot:TRINITY_DN2528_c0_g1_i1.p1 TRINITY_DN2528_c0_g1~~TRINITY_DN2528_c0_g1_i1.p1  ORF type:complete len:773 (+),score=236.64 TRINITY_DN2528_c0_g1_i1:45-2321(+)